MLHAQDYMVYAYLQLAPGQQSARRDRRDVQRSRNSIRAVSGADFALRGQPGALRDRARRLERRDGARSQAEPLSPLSMPSPILPARSGRRAAGQPAAAKADIAKLAELRDKLREANNAYWAEQVDIQWQVASAWVLFAEGKHDEALRAMSAAADVEDKTEKAPVTPGPIAPARELYGYMLLERGMAREALAAFEVDASEGAEPLSRLSPAPRRRPSGWATRPRRRPIMRS